VKFAQQDLRTPAEPVEAHQRPSGGPWRRVLATPLQQLGDAEGRVMRVIVTSTWFTRAVAGGLSSFVLSHEAGVFGAAANPSAIGGSADGPRTWLRLPPLTLTGH
jgi:hypothetical protein